MITKISYLSFPGPGRYVWNYQPFGSEELISVEIPFEQMRNIFLQGNEMMLRECFHPVPFKQNESAQ